VNERGIMRVVVFTSTFDGQQGRNHVHAWANVLKFY